MYNGKVLCYFANPIFCAVIVVVISVYRANMNIKWTNETNMKCIRKVLKTLKQILGLWVVSRTTHKCCTLHIHINWITGREMDPNMGLDACVWMLDVWSFSVQHFVIRWASDLFIVFHLVSQPFLWFNRCFYYLLIVWKSFHHWWDFLRSIVAQCTRCFVYGSVFFFAIYFFVEYKLEITSFELNKDKYRDIQ